MGFHLRSKGYPGSLETSAEAAEFATSEPDGHLVNGVAVPERPAAGDDSFQGLSPTTWLSHTQQRPTTSSLEVPE